MDGNRRLANKSHIKKRTGHAKGFDKRSETLQWCLDIGITEVTVQTNGFHESSELEPASVDWFPIYPDKIPPMELRNEVLHCCSSNLRELPAVLHKCFPDKHDTILKSILTIENSTCLAEIQQNRLLLRGYKVNFSKKLFKVQCKICSKVLANKYSFRRHFEAKHSNEKQHQN